jgi:hypothetical protein
MSLASLTFLDDLCDRSWFSRMWTIQETAMAKDCHIICGTKELNWQDFVTAISVLSENEKPLSGLASLNAHHVMAKGFISGPKLSLKEHRDSFKTYRDFLEEWQCELLFMETRDLPLLSTFNHCRKLQTTEPRDKVFALVPMIQEVGMPFLAVDYSSTVEEIYTQAAKAIIEETGSLYILSTLARSQIPENLPSWVPDWRQYVNSPCNPSVSRGLSAGLDSWFQFSENGFQLYLKGTVIDRVSTRATHLESMESVMENLKAHIHSGKRRELQNSQWRDIYLREMSHIRTFRDWLRVAKLNSNRITTGDSDSKAKLDLRDVLSQSVDWHLGPESKDISHWDVFFGIINAIDGPLDTKISAEDLENILAKGCSSHDMVIADGLSIPQDVLASVEYKIFDLLWRLTLEVGTNSLYLEICDHFTKHSIFATEQGKLGVATSCIKESDLIACILGIDGPVVLRQLEGAYQFISFCNMNEFSRDRCSFWAKSNGPEPEIFKII